MAIDFNPTILGRPLFPSSQVTGDFLSGVGRSVRQAFTPAAGTPPATMAGVSIPPAGASLSQLQFKGPLLGRGPVLGPMFGLGGEQQQAPQPARQPYNYGLFAATAGLPSFDVTKTQTPFSSYSASAPQQISSALSMPVQGQAQPTTQPILPSGTTGQASRPMAGFARISDWSQNPLVQAAKATGDISAIAKATEQARNQGRNAFTPKDISGVSLAAMKASEPNAGFGGSRTPAEQQALLAQIRSQGPQMAQNRITQQEEFFKQKRAERAALAGSTQEAYKSRMSPQSIRQARNEYTSQQPSSIAGIQKQFQSMVPQFGTPMAQRGSVAGIRSSFNIPTGGPQPYQASGFNTGMNFNASTPILDNNRIGNPMSFNFGYGV